MLKIGIKIRNMRWEKGLTSSACARKMGISRQHWYEIEHQDNITVQTLLKVAMTLDCDIADLAK